VLDPQMMFGVMAFAKRHGRGSDRLVQAVLKFEQIAKPVPNGSFVHA
jgi:hypothetical protein